eukprot:TRINITY_DN60320_c0_g1_i1.p2 TRINITY_DN60320_c0_g1~~TRINITY_DN60320_c0_g1_i1.p2  ORF type:complete len:226 (+),score=32.84 TRINITY_DN60320_c0_g1_i1:76-678(+)
MCNRAIQQEIISRDELEYEQAWAIEPKMDGLAVRLLYKNGVLVEAATRGNGSVGENVINNILQVQGVISQIKSNGNGYQIPELFEVRGEVFVTDQDFEVVNQERRAQGLEEFASQRNLAAGAIRLQDHTECRSRRLSFVAFQVLFDDEINQEVPKKIKDSFETSHYGRLQWLSHHNFAIHDPQHFTVENGFQAALEAGQK